MGSPSLQVIQSFIVGDPGSYWDYRDYIFCLTSNLSIKDCAFRLNIERGHQWAPEFAKAAREFGFTDFEITNHQPLSWSGYMMRQIDSTSAKWTMPWPGDHIYIHPDDEAFLKLMKTADDLNADAFAYSHVQDFDYLLDWGRINVLYHDENCVMIEWGQKYFGHQNSRFMKEAVRLLGHEIVTTPVPGFVVYKTKFFREILGALSPDTKRWQDMEFSKAKSAHRFRLLIPKHCLYRHVHGYWLEGFLKYWRCGPFPDDVKAEIESWYVPTEYDFKEQTPTRHEYRASCLRAYPYFSRYVENGPKPENCFGSSPFDTGWRKPLPLVVAMRNGKHKLMSFVRRCLRCIRKKVIS